MDALGHVQWGYWDIGDDPERDSVILGQHDKISFSRGVSI